MISRIEGFSPEREMFLLRDEDDESFLVTRDARTFHPIREREGNDILSHPDFQKALNYRSFVSINGSMHQKTSDQMRRGFAADRDFVYSLRPFDDDYEANQPLDPKVVSVWSSA